MEVEGFVMELVIEYKRNIVFAKIIQDTGIKRKKSGIE